MARSKLIATARRLRREMTDVERRLWALLRQRPEGVKFRRQHPIGRYVTDFACIEIKLIIELDGGQHNNPDIQCRDQARTDWLESQGWTVIRFWNTQVYEGLDQLSDQLIGLIIDLKRHPREPSSSPPLT